MDDILHTDAAKKAIKELFIAFIATVITIAVAAALFTLAPRWRSSWKTANTGPLRVRTFQKDARGGRITYQPSKSTEGGRMGPGDLKKDLEILSRRFARAQFEISLLVGFRDSALDLELKKNAAHYRYAVTLEGNQAVLRIDTNHPGALRALHDYLDYLQKRWVSAH